MRRIRIPPTATEISQLPPLWRMTRHHTGADMTEGPVTYVTARRAGAPVGTISFDPGDPGVSRFIATTADGRLAARITDTGLSFHVQAGKRDTVCPHWQAAAEAAFGPGVALELA
jgi:hypothetical protein